VPNGTATAVAPNFRPSYAEQFNLGVEHEIVPLENGVEVRWRG